MIYLDHAATSWPKPPEVIRAMVSYLEEAGGNPGRSGHRLSIEAGRIVYDVREAIAELFRAPDPLRVIFTRNVTESINIVLRGYLAPGDRVVTSSMEHNAVMRPLRSLERQGVRVKIVQARKDGVLPLDSVRAAIVPGTKLVVINHGSNVVGTMAPLAEIARIADDAGALLMTDAAQTAGVVRIDMLADGIDFLAFTGHKALQGPPGTGGLIFGKRVDTGAVSPLIRGGTGSRSDSEVQPEDLPDKFESGTPNGVGIAGLGAGVRFVQQRGIDAIRQHEIDLARTLIEGLGNVSGVTVHGTSDPERMTATVSFTAAGLRVSEIGMELDEEYGVLCRVGLHCAPATHRTIGTFPEGTVRMAPGVFTTLDDIRAVVRAVEKVVRR